MQRLADREKMLKKAYARLSDTFILDRAFETGQEKTDDPDGADAIAIELIKHATRFSPARRIGLLRQAEQRIATRHPLH